MAREFSSFFLRLTAPTASTSAASAGVPIFRHLLSPCWPTLFITSIPFSVAVLAAKLM
ncbi:MAG: hypothetical protein ACJAYZ_000808 [Bacteroidia bacterium]